MSFHNFFNMKYPHYCFINYSNISNILVFKLNKSVSKYMFLNSIMQENDKHLVIVDPGDLILYLKKKHEYKLRYLINNNRNGSCYFYNYFFRKLFTFSSNVINIFKQYKVYDFINSNNVNTIGVHIRLGKFGDFHERNATYFTSIKNLSLFNYTIRKIKRKFGIKFIVLSSDSSYITNRNNTSIIIIRNIFKSKILKHSNKWYFNSLNNDSIECLFEMYLLSKSKYLVLTKNSAFSKVAYYLNKNCDTNICKFL